MENAKVKCVGCRDLAEAQQVSPPASQPPLPRLLDKKAEVHPSGHGQWTSVLRERLLHLVTKETVSNESPQIHMTQWSQGHGSN